MTILANTRKFKSHVLKRLNLSDLSRETGVGISYLNQIINGKRFQA